MKINEISKTINELEYYKVQITDTSNKLNLDNKKSKKDEQNKNDEKPNNFDSLLQTEIKKLK